LTQSTTFLQKKNYHSIGWQETRHFVVNNWWKTFDSTDYYFDIGNVKGKTAQFWATLVKKFIRILKIGTVLQWDKFGIHF
jgi:hypothetical protein